MSKHKFELMPMPGLAFAKCSIDGSLIIGPSLKIIYRISGAVDQLIWPETTNKPRRLDKLWEKTCLELFIADSGQDAYYEFNFSPSGDWQCYKFSSYRKFSAKPALQNPPTISNNKSANEFSIDICVDIDSLPLRAPLDIGINAVLQQPTGALTFYSLSHQDAIPNFHQRDSFAMKIT